jgi:serine/threonine protein kinase
MAKLYGGRWKLLGSINEGGQGTVFRATDERGEFSGEWALKRLKNADRVERFRREVETLRRLGHENIIKLIEAQVAEQDDEKSYLVMPIAAGGDLNRRLPMYTGFIGPIVDVVLQIAAALEYAHKQGIIHRDIKPGNILFPDADHKVWVADFGISFDEAAERQTLDGEVVGPRFFIAPELEEGGTVSVTPAADIFSLGQLIFYMLSGGKRAAVGHLFDQRYAELFKGPQHDLLRLLLNKMIAPKETRYSDMARVIEELRQIENWEQTVPRGLLDVKALATVGKLQHRIAEKTERRATHEAQRQADLDLIQGIKSSILTWLKAQLEATKAICCGFE